MIVQALQEFSLLTVSADEHVESIGDKGQLSTLIVASADGRQVIVE